MEEFPRLKIHHLGPIDDCDLTLIRMMVLNGPQASGKSTIAKAVLFFRTVWEVMEQAWRHPPIHDGTISRDGISQRGGSRLRYDGTWVHGGRSDQVAPKLNVKFQQIFGSAIDMDAEMSISFDYAPGIWIRVEANPKSRNPREPWNSLLVRLSPAIEAWMREHDDMVLNLENVDLLHMELKSLFHESQEMVYIPAGRCMLSLWSPIGAVLMGMNDNEKSSLDSCTLRFLLFATQIQRKFNLGAERMFDEAAAMGKTKHLDLAQKAMESMERILGGRYQYQEGAESLLLRDTGKSIPVKFASSGQQEALWILNPIFYHLLHGISTCFIIEEPEAHLFPDMQKKMAEFISLSLGNDNACIVTTHSPYMLGAMSNLLEAHRLMKEGINISSLLEEENLYESQLLNRKDFSAYYLSDGKLVDAMDDELDMIRNELIDGASDAINRFSDNLIDIERKSEAEYVADKL